MCGVGLGRTVSFSAIDCVLSHDPLFALELGDLERIAGLVRAREEGLHSMVLEFGLGKKVRFVHCVSVCRYPLVAVRVRRTEPADRARVISERMDLRRQQAELCFGWLVRTLLVLRFLHGLFTRESACLLAGSLSASTGGCFARELFRLEVWISVAGEVAELIAEIPGLHLEGAECVFGVLPEFRVCVPDSHLEEEIENRLVVGREEEAVEHSDATLDRKDSEKQSKVYCMADLEYVLEVSC